MRLRAPLQGAAIPALPTQGIARDVTDLLVLQEFSRQVGRIIPVCSVCHRIRVSAGQQTEWLPLAEYVERKTGVMFSHTFCPEHTPATH